jgi:hypothetical protein
MGQPAVFTIETRTKTSKLIYESATVKCEFNSTDTHVVDQMNGKYNTTVIPVSGINTLKITINNKALPLQTFTSLELESLDLSWGETIDTGSISLYATGHKQVYIENILSVEQETPSGWENVSLERTGDNYDFKVTVTEPTKIRIKTIPESLLESQEFELEPPKKEDKEEPAEEKDISKETIVNPFPEGPPPIVESKTDGSTLVKISSLEPGLSSISHVEFQKRMAILDIIQSKLESIQIEEDKPKRERSQQWQQSYQLKGDVNVLIAQTTNLRGVMQEKIATLIRMISTALEMDETLYYYLLVTISEKIIEQAKGQISRQKNTAFAYAAILIGLSKSYPAFLDVFLAIMNKKCPWTIPKYITQGKDQEERDYLLELGFDIDPRSKALIKQSDYAERMSGIVILYAAFLQWPIPRFDHPHGLNFAWKWITSLCNMIPNQFTVLFLNDFLSICGFALLIGSETERSSWNQKTNSGIGENTLFHWESSLVTSSSNFKNISFIFLTQRVSDNFLADSLVKEESQFIFIITSESFV